MLLNRAPLGVYGLAGGVVAAGSAVANAVGEAVPTSTAATAADPANSSAQASAAAARQTFAVVAVPLVSTAIGVVEAANTILAESMIQARARVRGTWQSVGYGNANSSATVNTAIVAERISAPPTLSCSGVATATTAIDPIAFSPITVSTAATATVYGDPAVLAAADSILYIDASSFLVIGSAAVVSTIEYDYALTTSACFSEAAADAQFVTHGAGDCQAIAATSSSGTQQGFAFTALALVQSSATGLVSSADRAAYAAADLTPGLLVENTSAVLGVTTATAVTALVAGDGIKLRDTEADASVTSAMVEAGALRVAEASGTTVAPGVGAAAAALINDLYLAPEERTIYVKYDDRGITVNYESRLLEVA